MKSSLLVTLAIWLLAPILSAQAQIKIDSAYYGRPAPERTVDVKNIVQATINNGGHSIRVSPRTFGVNPNPGRVNSLVVIYYSYGQKRIGRGNDGDGIYFDEPDRRPTATLNGGRLRFENGYNRVVFLYELDRWGSWNWKAQLDPGSVYGVNAQPGDLWAVTDRRGSILKQVRVPRELGLIRLQ